jgi:NAD(P)-dependent dehydrogenase (short-subunit alcohol dehydrogenase family)
MSNPTNLSGKVAVVTGASRGLGQRVALRLAKHGAAVALVARTEALLAETADLIRQQGGTAAAFPANTSDAARSAEIGRQVREQFGAPSILVNGAGVFGPIELLQDSDPAQWVETIMINTIGPYLYCRTFVNGMIEQGWGRIINFTSAASLHPPGFLNSAYGTSKVAVNQMTRHLAAELEGTGVTANVIHPGDVKTDMWEYIRGIVEKMPGKPAEAYLTWAQWVEETGGDDPEKAADLVLNLMSDEAASVTGQFLWIEDGLQAPIPSWGEPTSTQPWRKK